MTNMSIWYEHYKVKNYDAAYDPWKMVLDACPDMNKGLYSGGERILKHKIKNSSGADQDGYIQDLLALYDASNKYFAANNSAESVACDKAVLWISIKWLLTSKFAIC